RIGAGIDHEDSGLHAVGKAAATIQRARQAERAALFARVESGPGSADAAEITAEARWPGRAADRPIAPVGDPLVHVPDHVEPAPGGLAARPGARVGGTGRTRHARRRAVVGETRIRRASGRALPLAVGEQPLSRQQAGLVRLEPGDAAARLD